MGKKRLVFDTTTAQSIADSDSVGAYVRAGSDGDLIASQTINSEEWLNVASVMFDETGSAISDLNPLAVSVKDGVNVEVDLSHLDDSVRLGDGTDFFTSTTVGADIGLDVNLINASIAVTATDLDIRDLTQTDEITAFQGGTWTIDSITNDVNIADGGNSITVDAVQLDIDDLNATDDAVQSWLYDGAGTALTSTLVGADQALDVNLVNEVSVNDAALANTDISASANTLSVADTAQDIVASPLADRKYLFVYNSDNQDIYIGGTGVSTADGYPLFPDSEIMLRCGAAVDIEFVGSAGKTPEIRTLELS